MATNGLAAALTASIVVCFGADALAAGGTVQADGSSGLSTWVVDASAGVPRLRSSGDFNLVGDLTLGWASPSWGVVASGHAHTFALDNDTTLSDLDAYSARGEGFIRFGGDTAALELLARLAAALYDTTFIEAPATGVSFQDETSATYESAVLVGARLQPSNQWHVQLLVGGGAYDEEYNATQSNAGASSIVDRSRVAGRGELLLQLRWTTVPEAFSLRLRSEGHYYSLTRSTDVVAIIGGSVGTTSGTDTVTQLETSSRLFAHADALSFGGVLPALFGGLDTLSVSASGGSKTNVVPVIGIGLFKPGP